MEYIQKGLIYHPRSCISFYSAELTLPFNFYSVNQISTVSRSFAVQLYLACRIMMMTAVDFNVTLGYFFIYLF